LKSRLVWLGLSLVIVLIALMVACRPAPTATPAPPELILRNWEGDISADILAAFEAE
jgi:spermidine/putrescine-binding protein